MVEYSKFDNFIEKTQKQYQVQHYRCVTLADGTVDKTPQSIQNIERQERRLQNEYREKYGLRLKKQKANEELSNDRLKESKIQQPMSNARYEEEKVDPSANINRKREEKKFQKDNDKDSYASVINHAMMSSDEDTKENEDKEETITTTKKKKGGKSNKGKGGRLKH